MTVRLTVNTMTASLDKIKRDLSTVPNEVYNYWKSITPIRTGNARRKTKLKGDTIHANYPYAVPLDEGYSKQAPKGMTKPSEAYLKKILAKKMRK